MPAACTTSRQAAGARTHKLVRPVGSRRQGRGDTGIDGRTDVIDGRTDAADGRLEGARASQTWVPLLTLTHGDDPGNAHNLGHFSARQASVRTTPSRPFQSSRSCPRISLNSAPSAWGVGSSKPAYSAKLTRTLPRSRRVSVRGSHRRWSPSDAAPRAAVLGVRRACQAALCLVEAFESMQAA